MGPDSCDHCGARQSELQLQGPNGPLRPHTYAQRDAIRVLRVPGPFVLSGTEALPHAAMAEWLAWLQRREDRAAAKALRAQIPRGRARRAASAGPSAARVG